MIDQMVAASQVAAPPGTSYRRRVIRGRVLRSRQCGTQTAPTMPKSAVAVRCKVGKKTSIGQLHLPLEMVDQPSHAPRVQEPDLHTRKSSRMRPQTSAMLRPCSHGTWLLDPQMLTATRGATSHAPRPGSLRPPRPPGAAAPDPAACARPRAPLRSPPPPASAAPASRRGSTCTPAQCCSCRVLVAAAEPVQFARSQYISRDTRRAFRTKGPNMQQGVTKGGVAAPRGGGVTKVSHPTPKAPLP